MGEFIEELKLGVYQTFILDSNYQYFLEGIKVTLLVTVFALMLGLVLGVIVAIIRSAHDQQPEKKKGIVLRVLNGICKVYLTVIRGTPTMIQLLIMYYVIFGSVNIDKRIVAILAFGINSGAYVAEIVRSGIMAIDIGQFEAGRSLGLGYPATMWHIILPQAFKNVLPALGNEIIVLLKETSISGYIALTDLTHGGNVIRSQTYSAFMPLIAVALIYLAIVSLLAAGVSRLERRLRTSER